MPSTFDLNCLVLGDDPGRVFPVKIAASESVGILRKLIKDEKKPAFDHVDADTLVLWKVSIPVDKSFKESLSRNDFVEEHQVEPMQELVDIFTEPLVKKHIHIMIKAPPIAISNEPDVLVANTLYNKLWTVDLDSVLDNTSDNSGKNFKYLSTERVTELQLPRMNYLEGVLLIRTEYHIVFEKLVSRASSPSRGGGVVVTGQPGIGKSCFLFYVLLVRLSKGLPTALQTSSESFYLFTETGAKVHPVSVTSSFHLPKGCWALTDSNEGVGAPCGAFLRAAGPDVWVVQATSPLRSRWYEWSKQRLASMLVMDWFPSNELTALGKILALNDDNLLRHYNTWGPSARTCVTLERGIKTTGALEWEVEFAAKDFVSDPQNVLSSIGRLDAYKVSHVLFALWPESLESRDVASAEIATTHLQGFVIRATSEVELVKQSHFFTTINSHPWFRGSAGSMFEKFVHVRLTAHPSSKPLKGIPANGKLALLNIPVCRNPIPLGGLSRLKGANKYELPFYWRPTNQSFTSVDSLICTKNAGLFIQSTVSHTHDAKPEGLQEIFENLPKQFVASRKWALVFITDTDDNAVALRTQKLDGLPENVEVYSCTFKIGQSALTSTELEALAEITKTRENMEEVPDEEMQETVAEGSTSRVSHESPVRDTDKERKELKRKRAPTNEPKPAKRRHQSRAAKNNQK